MDPPSFWVETVYFEESCKEIARRFFRVLLALISSLFPQNFRGSLLPHWHHHFLLRHSLYVPLYVVVRSQLRHRIVLRRICCVLKLEFCFRFSGESIKLLLELLLFKISTKEFFKLEGKKEEGEESERIG